MGKIIDLPAVLVTFPGSMPVTITNTVNVETPGPSLFKEGLANSTPNVPQTLISVPINTVPVGKTWRIRRIEVISRAYSVSTAYKNAAIIKKVYNSPVESTVSLSVEPWEVIAPGDTLSLVYDQTDGPIVPITARIYYTEQ